MKFVCLGCETLHHVHEDAVYQNLDYKLTSGSAIKSPLITSKTPDM